ncbi:MAG: hypothetical protein ACFFER_02515 [Candidatus Thorarchaeota archaeon]
MLSTRFAITMISKGPGYIGIYNYTLIVDFRTHIPAGDKVIVTVLEGLGPEISLSRSLDSPAASRSVTVFADVDDFSEIAEVTLRYSIDDGSTWTEVSMDLSESTWSATIPGQDHSVVVRYYVYASDVLGYSTTTPVMGYTVMSEGATIPTGIIPEGQVPLLIGGVGLGVACIVFILYLRGKR